MPGGWKPSDLCSPIPSPEGCIPASTVSVVFDLGKATFMTLSRIIAQTGDGQAHSLRGWRVALQGPGEVEWEPVRLGSGGRVKGEARKVRLTRREKEEEERGEEEGTRGGAVGRIELYGDMHVVTEEDLRVQRLRE
jgi:hypothetical protein